MYLENLIPDSEKPNRPVFFKRRVAEAFNVGRRGLVTIVVILILLAIIYYFCMTGKQ